MNESKSENSIYLSLIAASYCLRSLEILPRKQTAVVHANQRPGHNSLGGWEIHDLAAVVQTDQRPGNKRDLPYTY
jgi:hypothetical protein